MTDKKVFPQSQVPIRKTSELLPNIFKTSSNEKFLSGVLDPTVQPGTLEKISGYLGRKYGKTFNSVDNYLDVEPSLRSAYQLEPGVVHVNENRVTDFYDYIDFKNQLSVFNNNFENDTKTTSQTHYTWNPPIDWDKFVNFREYYWEPAGPLPVPVTGQSIDVDSTYSVSLGVGSSFIFSPDGLTNNPIITLYRGQTYRFNVNVPGEGFSIRTNYDTGSLLFNPNFPYVQGQLVVFANNIWKATKDLVADPNRIVSEDSGDWELLSAILDETPLLYNNGVTNNGAEVGTVEFTVPFDAPDRLFYQGTIDPNRVGQFIISDIESNTFLDVNKDIIGKQTFKASNGVEFTNGLVVEFRGKTLPKKYEKDTWLVEGVGSQITLTRFRDLIAPAVSDQELPAVLFDNQGFDVEPFDDATNFPKRKDYITIKKSSNDLNPWSRYNRWFHKSVLEYSYRLRGQTFVESQDARAKRPIIEFNSGLQLFDHGAVAKQPVDFLDNFTTDVFSVIEGSTNYSVDGEFLFEGARVLFTADNDSLVNNKIYKVKFTTFKNRKQITLVETDDSDPLAGEGVLIIRGNTQSGKMYHFTGDSWVISQEKQTVNQSPLFDAFDNNGVSFSDQETYLDSSFKGTTILEYKKGKSISDAELGFSLSYLNIDNVGDLQFNWTWESDQFTFVQDRRELTQLVSRGFYKNNLIDAYDNGWLLFDNSFSQPIIETIIVKNKTNRIISKAVDWKTVDFNNTIVRFYRNNQLLADDCEWLPFERQGNEFIFSREFNDNDVICVKVIGDVLPDQGYYKFPIGLEKNPLNEKLKEFTLGQATDHLMSGIEFSKDTTLCSSSVTHTGNLRDINGYQKYSEQFLKHDSLAPLAVSLICDKENNIIKSIQYAKKAYSDFKNLFLEKSVDVEFNDNIPEFVDTIISLMTRTKSSTSVFAGSDMIGSGAHNTITYSVDDSGINVFALSQPFSLAEASDRAVYVYINGRQLLNEFEYRFDSAFGFVTITKQLHEGDIIEIKEYISTASNFIPPTPTSMGMYQKYTPEIFVDDTYLEPKTVIQGHDGSITLAFGDFRDDLLLELEYRIYNNIKVEYQHDVLDINSIIGGYYNTASFTKQQFDEIASQEFLKWLQNSNINYVDNSFFRDTESFTYTYSNMLDPSRTQNIPGWWRGVYQWFYDTDRPHRCPWEMLGFSQKPSWWEDEYGPAPYTSNNLILWEDLRDGVIRQGKRTGKHKRYSRPTLLNHIPVDRTGKLLSPLDSNLAQNFVLLNASGSFTFGDIGPAEYAWRSSSEWPFVVMLALATLQPFDFVSTAFNKTLLKTNKLGQKVTSNGDFVTLSDLTTSLSASENLVGISQYLKNYIMSKGIGLTSLTDWIQSIDVRLSSRLSGFVDKQQQKFLLDSKNPASAASGVFIPQENYDIFFNVSSPISMLAYSGVIIEKTSTGWTISGYDKDYPFFKFFTPVPSQKDPVVAVGGVSANFTQWSPGRTYSNGQIVEYISNFYRANSSHTATDVFDQSLWRKISKLPTVGGVEAQRRTTFNTLRPAQLEYGTTLSSIQQVVDFLLGYGEYLKSVGFVFDGYDFENKTSQDWVKSCKEFMFWTSHSWADGSLITLSPASEKVEVEFPVGVAENLLDSFYGYQVFKSDGAVLQPRFLDVSRDFGNVKIKTQGINDGIYFIKLFYVLKEHVVIFDNRTVFNDVIYDAASGYRQLRIKTLGFRTTDWDGDYTSPGFIFDNIDLDAWQPFVDYKLGDIVEYKTEYWTAQKNHLSLDDFDSSKWKKTQVPKDKQLVANFDYRINQIEDYYSVSSEGLGKNQRNLARHLIGYQPREYLADLAEDDVTQFQLYRGFIQDKGTSSVISKVFDKISRTDDTSVSLKEEWAFKVGEYGGTAEVAESEFKLLKEKFNVNPQPIILVDTVPEEQILDKNYRVDRTQFTLNNYTSDVNVLSNTIRTTQTAGYVSTLQIDFVVRSKKDILDVDFSQVQPLSHFWVTFDRQSWTVLRFEVIPSLYIISADVNNQLVDIRFNRIHKFTRGDIVGIYNVSGLSGFFEIIDASAKTITIRASEVEDIVIENPAATAVGHFVESRFLNSDQIPDNVAANLKIGSKIWIDEDENNQWKVIEKLRRYSAKMPEIGDLQNLNRVGTSISYNQAVNQVLATSANPAQILAYSDTGDQDELRVRQIISAPNSFLSEVTGKFGESISTSLDGKWLAVGTPKASFIRSSFLGEFDPTLSYAPGDIVLFGGQLWKARRDVFGDGSTIDIGTEDWEPATLVSANAAGVNPGYENQGMISLYRNAGSSWVLHDSFVSPRQAVGERFGHAISFAQENSEYYMTVTALGSSNNKGRVYLYVYKNNQWQHDKNPNFAGVYESSKMYPKGTIVWYDSRLWKARVDITGDDSTIGIDDVESDDWLQLDQVATHNSLPQAVSVADDQFTKSIGVIGSEQLIEILQADDHYGYATAMSATGNILVVGAPNSNNLFFENYKGSWKTYQQYAKDDVVLYQQNYYKLTEDTSVNDQPGVSVLWESITPVIVKSGKLFIYRKNSIGSYDLVQAISSNNINNINLTGDSKDLELNDQFGFSVDVSGDGNTIIAAAPRYDFDNQDQGAVFVFELIGSEFKLTQKLSSFESYPNEFFGHSVSMTTNGEKIAIGAKNSPFTNPSLFDSNQTSFDNGRTGFVDQKGFAGAVYLYSKIDNRYRLTEQLEDTLSKFESFGYSVDCSDSVVAVGSPNYVSPSTDNNTGAIIYQGPQTGTVRLFRKNLNTASWQVIGQQQPLVDISRVASISLYNSDTNLKIQDLDFIDAPKGKILNIAEQELTFKTFYDPAVYSLGTEDVVIDKSISWKTNHVGELWWDLSTVKWVEAEQGDIAYKISKWNELAKGASVDVYEWVETDLLPSEWAELADTTEGLAQGISGVPKHPDNSVYTEKTFLNPDTGAVSRKKYYYWVKNSVIVPQNVVGRRISAADVSSLIERPKSSGIAFLSLIDSNKFLAYNFENVIRTDSVLLNIRCKNSNSINQIHKEFQLLTEDNEASVPSLSLETKWIDSLIGSDAIGNQIPDPMLPEKQKYGIMFRPRQGMFIDSQNALKLAIENVNRVLLAEPFADVISYKTLNLSEPAPEAELNLYDSVVSSEIELDTVKIVRVRPAVLEAEIINGQVVAVNIVDSGFGYRAVPPVVIEGDGEGAEAEAVLDRDGRVSSVNVLRSGKNYSTATLGVRAFSVLVESDRSANGFWSIYSWDETRKQFFKTRTQKFNTSRLWEFIDWWDQGYSSRSAIVKEISFANDVERYDLELGELIRVKEYGAGGWAVFEKIADRGSQFLQRYKLVGRQNGTIKISDIAFDTTVSGIGYDAPATAFDLENYSFNFALELRNIFRAIKEDIFIGKFKVEWNRLFFASVRYAFAEQMYLDWAFKTSFLSATHNVGDLVQKINYQSDRLESFKQYIDEVKPFRTTIREYVSKYNNSELTDIAVGDFDLPPVFSQQLGKSITVTDDSELTSQLPWKLWADNNKYSVVSIVVSNPGEFYSQPPKVLISGDGTGASAVAFVSNGRLSRIQVTDGGHGYTRALVTLVGGNVSSATAGKATAILGNAKVRSFNLGVKFDRISKRGKFDSTVQTDTIVASGATAAFDLSYPPLVDLSKTSVTIDGQTVISNEYSIEKITRQVGDITEPSGKIVFAEIPAKDQVIEVRYEKDNAILDSVNRINKYYSPSSGMRDKDPAQLMTGIDFGGVMVQGTTFDVTGGWDASPWFTDSWDSIEDSGDLFFVINLKDLADPKVNFKVGDLVKLDNTVYIAVNHPYDNDQLIVPGSSTSWQNYWEVYTLTLPMPLAAGELLTVYYRAAGQSAAVRIDDVNFDSTDNSLPLTNVNAMMPTVTGDGSTTEIDIQSVIELNNEDAIVLRKITSDGAISINDVNLLDTAVTGGTFDAYSTASGMTADEIIISGESFVSPDQVPAPEENVPGQVLDSFSIKVFNTVRSGSAPIHRSIYTANGEDNEFGIGLDVIENTSVIVYVNSDKLETNSGYSVDLSSNSVVFEVPPSIGSLIEIVAVGLGGAAILDYRRVIADGKTTQVLLDANFSDTTDVFITRNGIAETAEFINSSELLDVVNKVVVQFGIPPEEGEVINIVATGLRDESAISLIGVNQQTLTYDGSTRSFEIDSFTNLSNASAESAIVVELNGTVLKGPDSVKAVFDGENRSVVIGVDPQQVPGAILASNIEVFVNRKKLQFITDYVFDGLSKTVTITSRMLPGDKILIVNNFSSEYTVVDNQLMINQTVQLNESDTVTITWFDRYDILEIFSDQYRGEQVFYRLPFEPINLSYVWVYKNGKRLVHEIDYRIDKNLIYLADSTSTLDLIQITAVGSTLYTSPSAYQIHQDMFNINRFNRFSYNRVVLARPLAYFDREIEVNDASLLITPNLDKKISGVIYVNGERIEYLQKTGNVLSNLRRGVHGTAIPEIHSIGSRIVDIGPRASLPYKEAHETAKFDHLNTTSFVHDGSTKIYVISEDIFVGQGEPGNFYVELNGKRLARDVDYFVTLDNFEVLLEISDKVDIEINDTLTVGSLLVGPLSFIPPKTDNTVWNRKTIPESYGQCNSLDVFVGGRRLRKSPVTVYEESIGYNVSKSAVELEAEFSVSGDEAYIRLSEIPNINEQILIVRRTGKTWHEPGISSASTGKSLINSNSIVARFIAEKTTELPE